MNNFDIKEAVDALEENENEVECKCCFDLFPKEDCIKTENGYYCKKCSQELTSHQGTNLDLIDNDPFSLNYEDPRDPEEAEELEVKEEPVDANEVRKHEAGIEESLKVISDFDDYKPWSGAVDTYELIKDAGKLDELEAYLEDCYPDGVTATQINDILWFDSEDVLSYLGLGDVEEDEDFDEALNENTFKQDFNSYNAYGEELEEDFEDSINKYRDVKVGDKIRIIHLKDEDNTYDGKEGIIEYIDDIGQLHGSWGGLGVIPGVDDYEVIIEEHINDRPADIESDQELQGNDNAVVDCEVAKVVAHSEDEKPLDCKIEKPALEEPLAGDKKYSLNEGIFDFLSRIDNYYGKDAKKPQYKNNKYGYIILIFNNDDTKSIAAKDKKVLVFNTFKEAEKYVKLYSKKETVKKAEVVLNDDRTKVVCVFKQGVEDKQASNLNAIVDEIKRNNKLGELEKNASAGEEVEVDNKAKTEDKEEQPVEQEQPQQQEEAQEQSAEQEQSTEETRPTEEEQPAEEQPVEQTQSAEETKAKNNRYKKIINALKDTGIPIDKLFVKNGVGKNGKPKYKASAELKKLSKKLFDESLKENIEQQETFTPEEQKEYNCDEDGNCVDSYDTLHHCGWCGDVFTEYEMRHEADFGWICPRCVEALKSQGDHLVFIEGKQTAKSTGLYTKEKEQESDPTQNNVWIIKKKNIVGKPPKKAGDFFRATLSGDNTINTYRYSGIKAHNDCYMATKEYSPEEEVEFQHYDK